MNPFDLERALAGDPVCTRGGVDVPFITYDSGAWPQFRILFRKEGRNGHFYAREDGSACEGEESPNDLFMKPKKVTKWANLYPDSWEWFNSKDMADRCAELDRLGGKAHPIEIEE